MGPHGLPDGLLSDFEGEPPSPGYLRFDAGEFRAVNDAESVPGAGPKNCGNYLMHNLGMAKWYAARFADYLAANHGNAEIFEYPKTERLVTDDGQHFYDS